MKQSSRWTRILTVWMILPSLVFGEGSKTPLLGSLADVEHLALQMHPTIRLARSEVETLAAKRREAYRAIWPTLSVKGEETRGEADRTLGTPDFTEKSYGVQLSQPLIQGGRLYRTYRQSDAQFEAAQAKYLKARHEVLFSAREAAWNLLKARKANEVYAKAFKDLKQELKSAEGLMAKDAITRQSYLTVEQQYNQALLVLQGSDAEVESRLWQLTAALGLFSPPELEDRFTLSTTTAPVISLEECLRLSRINHPDITIQRRSAEAAFQGNLVGKSYRWPKISVNGFYGRSGAAYDTEDFHMGKDWMAGVQLSQYFGLNTVNVSGLQQETSPKIGQSTRTATKTASGSVSILDGFKQKSEAKEAAFLYEQAEVQEERTELEVANGVREAYANMKKAIAQMKIADNGAPLAKAEYAIAKIKSAHREMPYSERAVTRNRLALAEAAIVEARAFYRISCAALDRAVGVPDLL